MRHVERLSRLAFVAPTIVEAICQGRQPTQRSIETLLNRIDLPLEWPAQLKALEIDQSRDPPHFRKAMDERIFLEP